MSPDPSALNGLEDRVIAIITKQKRLPPDRVTIDSSFADLGIDSLDGMELVFEFEEAFDLAIPDTTAREMQTVKQAVETLRQAMAVSTAGPSAPPAGGHPGSCPPDGSPAG